MLLRIIMVFGFLSLSITVLIAKLLQTPPPETNAQDSTRIIFFGLPSALIVLGAAYWNNQRVGLLSRIGDSSYSLYLTHGTLISSMMILLERFQLKSIVFKNELISATTSTAIFMVTILAAYFFYNVLERPSCRMARRLF
jgi:peptidoglycan/LPS O-acetylase OafA/YrhL